MTIPTLMNLLSAPGTGAVSAVSGAELPGSGEGFASLVQMLVAQQQAPGAAGQDPAAAQPGQPCAGEAAAGRAGGPVAGPLAPDRPGAETIDAAGTGVTAAPQPAEEQAGEQAGESAGEPAGVAAGESQPAAVAGAGQQAAAAATVVPVRVGAEAATPEGRPTGPAASGGVADGQTGRPADQPAGRPVDGQGGLSGGEPGGILAAAQDTNAGARDQQPGGSQPGGGQPGGGQVQLTGVTTASAPAAPVSAPTGGPAPAETAGPVGGQVFPEVARLVTRGDGTQRLTLRLSPESLGDVRIVVTVRDGAVDVSLAAGAEAQEALRHGSADLRRLLESIGASSTQIVVRDLPSGGPGTSGQGAAGQQPGTSTYAGTGDGHGRGAHGDGPGSEGGRAHRVHASDQPVSPRVPRGTATTTAPAGVDLRL